jgi:hypothetical protein
VSRDFQIGDMLEVNQPITTHTGAKVDSIFHVIVEKEYSMCNSDGEDWWIEWLTTVLETGKPWTISSRHSVYQNIVKVS